MKKLILAMVMALGSLSANDFAAEIQAELDRIRQEAKRERNDLEFEAWQDRQREERQHRAIIDAIIDRDGGDCDYFGR